MYICDICGISIKEKKHFKPHVDTKHKDLALKCPMGICAEKFECTICGGKFAKNSIMRAHQAIPNVHRNIKCQICKKISKSKVANNQHVKEVYNGVASRANLICTTCDKHFRTQRLLDQHQLSCETLSSDDDEWTKLVEQGNKKQEERLKSQNLKRVNLEAEFSRDGEVKCEQCGKVFISVLKLQAHLSLVRGCCKRFYVE